MKNLWNSIWFNLAIGVCLIAIGLYFFSGLETTPGNGTKLTIVLLALLSHTIYLLVIAIMNLVKKNFLKGALFFIQLAVSACLFFYGFMFALFTNAPMGVYTDEGSVNSAMQTCEFSNEINDSLFYDLFSGLTNNNKSSERANEKAIQDYTEAKPELTDSFSIAKKGCRTYEDSVIVFRLLYSNQEIYDVEIRSTGKNKFMITGFRYSVLMD